jgi:hypothetical protein
MATALQHLRSRHESGASASDPQQLVSSHLTAWRRLKQISNAWPQNVLPKPSGLSSHLHAATRNADLLPGTLCLQRTNELLCSKWKGSNIIRPSNQSS